MKKYQTNKNWRLTQNWNGWWTTQGPNIDRQVNAEMEIYKKIMKTNDEKTSSQDEMEVNKMEMDDEHKDQILICKWKQKWKYKKIMKTNDEKISNQQELEVNTKWKWIMNHTGSQYQSASECRNGNIKKKMKTNNEKTSSQDELKVNKMEKDDKPQVQNIDM